MPPLSRDGLRNIKRFDQLVKYLRDELEWPIEDTDAFEDLTFDYEPEELGIDTKTAAKIQEIKQLRPLVSTQPWGVFFVKFEPKRLPVMALRRMLSQLVIKRRANSKKSEQPTWHMHDLLFISNFGEGEQRQITFAHFSGGEDGELPTLKVLGWDDGNTALHIDHVHNTLKDKLHWPEDEDDLEQWRKHWQSAFTQKHREVITTSKQMSATLAELAGRIRKRMNAVMAMETENGIIRKLHKAFKEALIHDLSEDDFADMYAQTITYGLLTARVSRPAGLVAENVTDMIPITNPFLKDLLASFLKIGGRKNKLDFDELGVNDVVDTLREANMEAVLRDFGDRRPEEDPVIFFYEDFLKEYDKQKKVKRGVFYTPKPVVSYIVRSVHKLLQSEFGLKDGLADTTTWGEMAKLHKDLIIPEGAKHSDPFVTILDPATGTGTFLVEVIDVIYNTMTKKWKSEGKIELQFKQLWNEYVPNHLLPRLFGYELMMAPYAIAHMKIGLKLHETGYQFGTEERARIFLTNALEPAQDFSDQFEFFAPELANEAEAVNTVKWDQRFLVIIGNPPYSGESANKGEWITRLVKDYYLVDGKPLGEQNPKYLLDDYVKFLRFGQKKSEEIKFGIISMITNHGYIDNPTFRGMRQNLLNDMNKIYVFDLHGNAKKQEKALDGKEDKNVFDIQQGVTIGFFIKKYEKLINTAKAYHSDLYGSRPSKYKALLNLDISRTKWVALSPQTPYYLFSDFDYSISTEYDKYIPISEIFTINSTGVKTHRDHFVIDHASDSLKRKINDFKDLNLKTADIRQRYILPDTRDWKLEKQRSILAADSNYSSHFTKILISPFDMREYFHHEAVVELPKMQVTKHIFNRENYCLFWTRPLSPNYEFSVLASKLVGHQCVVGNKSAGAGASYIGPVYLFTDFGFRQPNINENFASNCSSRIQLKWISEGYGDMKKSFGPEDIFHYIYSVFYCPQYRCRYSDFLKIDFPRVPLPSTRDLFDDLTKLGAELVSLHLMEPQKLDNFITEWSGPTPSSEVEKPIYSKGTVWIDKAKTQGFKGVPEEVWNFYIGGYQVCDKWLKDRKAKGGRPGRQLSADDIAHYQRIVVALNETIRLMAEIDKVIDKHGGWTSAFKGKEE